MMMNVKTVAVAALAACVSAAAAARAGEAEPPADITPEQVAYLEESLGEGLGTGDARLVDMALEGLRATGRDERELVSSLERAALDAALSYPNLNERVKIDAWTLAARAKLGDASAAEVLNEWVRERGRALTSADRHDRKALMRSRIVPMRCAEALPCLAYLRVEGVGELAEEILRGEPAAAGDARARMISSSYGAPRLKGAMRVTLDLDHEKGTRLVLSLVDSDGLSVDHRAQLFGACAELLKDDDDAGDRLALAFRKLVDAMIARGFDERRPDPGMMALLSATLRWLPKREAVLEGLERLEAALPVRMKRFVTSRVGLYRRQLGLADKPKPDALRPGPLTLPLPGRDEGEAEF